jgi:hypothetical protein
MLGFPLVVWVLVRTRLGMGGINVQRGTSVAANESERQDQDEATSEQRAHKRRGLRVVLDYLRKFFGYGIARIGVID